MGRRKVLAGNLKLWSWMFLVLGLLPHGCSVSSLEMHFEPKDGGFFLRSSVQGSSSTSPTSSSSSSPQSTSGEDFGMSESFDGGIYGGGGDPALLHTEHFTVLPSSQPVSIRVMYGPFSTKQTVPVRLLVPDPLDGGGGFGGSNSTSSGGGGTSEPEMIPPLDLSAHIVTPTVPKDNPILRVLFHAGQTAFGLPISSTKGSRQQGGNGGSSRRHRTRLCLVAQATKSPGDIVTSSCTPDTRDSTCLAELTLPIHWWPQTNYDDNGAGQPQIKPTKIPIQVLYAVYEPDNGHCNEVGMSTTYSSGIPGEGGGSRRIQIQPPTPLSTVILTDAQKSYRIVKADASDALKLLVPQGPLYPHAKFYVPVILGKHEDKAIVAFIMRARVKSGLRIIGIEPNMEKGWNITTDFNPRRTHATITAVRKYDPKFKLHQQKSDGEEVFHWIFEAAEETVDDWDAGRVVWITRYVIQPTADTSWMKKDPFIFFSDERHKLTTRLEIQKDDIQAVLPIAKSWEVVNSAVLNAKQVSRPMKIFIVSKAGQVADVTLQASCRSLDESVLKVSSSCTSVYVDGSEIRGSTNATIIIKYGTYEGVAQFTVWMPEFPLDVAVGDAKLHQIKGWRIPNGLRPETQGKRDVSYSYTKGIEMQDDGPMMMGASSSSSSSLSTDINSYYTPTADDTDTDTDMDDLDDPWDDHHEEGEVEGGEVEHLELPSPTASRIPSNSNSNNRVEGEDDEEELEDKFHCRPRYQHTRVEVYGRFLAQDQDSGRTSYFISRKIYLKITDLVSDYLRVSDTQVAIIKGSSIQGVGPGRTEIQVVSPVTRRVLGTKEIRVLNERVSIIGMKVQVISGVQLSLLPDNDSDNQFVAETTMTSKLSAKYQEALLDIKVGFSDNSWVKLDEIDKDSYVLAVDSLEPSVVELPPIQNSKYPRIIAVSEGGGPMMRVSLELSDQCHRQNSSPLAISVAPVEVNFTVVPARSEFTQNDSNQGSLGSGGLSGINNKGSLFRKNGRKERKNNNKNLLHDITGIPLKDDSSKASISSSSSSQGPFGPIQVGFIPNKGWTFAAHNTPLEIAMYVLLGVFSVAILVFVASCFVYASRVKKRDVSGAEELMGFKMDGHPAFGLARGPTSNNHPGGVGVNAHDWVWLGRASLALHPSLDGSKHHPGFSTTSSSNRGGLGGGGGGLNPIRIITNPNFENMQGLIAAQQGPSSVSPSTPMSTVSQQGSSSRVYVGGGGGGLARNSSGSSTASVTGGVGDLRIGAPPPPRPPKPSHSNSNSVDSTTFSVRSGGGQNAGILSPAEVPDYRPPVPPHRNIPVGSGANSSSTGVSPPTSSSSSPPKGAGSTKPQQKSKSSSSNSSHPKRDDPLLPNPNFIEFPDQQNPKRRLGGAGGGGAAGGLGAEKDALALRLPPNIVGNPMSYIDEESEVDDEEEDYEEDVERPLTNAAASAIAARQGHRKGRQNINSSVKLDMDYDQLMEYFDNLKETEA